MQERDIIQRTQHDRLLINNEHYYKFIFKKTERIVCTILFVLESEHNKGQSNRYYERVAECAHDLLDTVIASLSTPLDRAADDARNIIHRVVALESALHIAVATKVIAPDVAEAFFAELEGVRRSLRQYIHTTDDRARFIGSLDGTQSPAEPAHKRTPSASSTQSSSAPRKVEHNTGARTARREAIIAVLSDKGEASIKDVAEVIRDASEKTIQRELNVLIKDNIVKREGERRWSRYSIL